MLTDTWHWRAVYHDGETLDEHHDDGTPRGFAEIEQERLRAFLLVSQREGLPGHVLSLTTDARPIFFRRRSKETTLEGEEVASSTVHCLGWQSTIKGSNVKSFTFLFDDGSVLVTDDLNAI